MMKKSFFPIGILILVVSLILVVVGTTSAAGECRLEILKQDQNGDALVGATFVISPDPTSTPPGMGELTVVDNGMNDNDPTDGVLLIIGCNYDPSLEYTVTETVAPPGYAPAPPQTTKIDDFLEPITITFINQPPVGGAAQPVNKVGVLIPWVGLAFIVIGGITWFALKRRST
jgi:hypothetical protein